MCGIVGFTGSRQSPILDGMLKSIIHRGPDGEGQYECNEFSIGMRRLAIIDVNGGWQPIWNEDNTMALVYNGEIYNYQSIWKELEAKGHKFKSNHSDSETLIHGYEEWGKDILPKLRGMFAFAIYDKKKNEIFIARDRLGIKPLYYTQKDGRIYFASEIKALLGVPGVEPKLNKQILLDYLIYRTHDHTSHTFFEGIEKLPAGNYMRLSSSGEILAMGGYWDPEVNVEFYGPKSDEEYAEELRSLFIDSVQSHLISDVPVGVTLSGGLDSTGVVSIMSKLFKEKNTDLHTKNLLTFSAVYPNDPIDETKYIDIAAAFAGSEQHKITPTPDLFWTDINEWLYTQEEPTISSAPYAIYSVMREASKYVRVMLSGQGGDELFAGYIPYFASYLSSAKNQGKYFEAIRESLMGMDMYWGFFKQKLFGQRNSNIVNINDLVNKSAFNVKPDIYKIDSNLNQRLFLDVTKFSVPNVLRYEDKNAMAFSIETRVPFLDHKFVEYVLKLPIDQKIKYGWNRYIYRNAMKGLIPDEIRKRRKKIGFTTPETRWMREKAETIREIFSSKEFMSHGLFDHVKVLEDYNKWVSGEKPGDAMTFWRILNTELWIRRFNISI